MKQLILTLRNGRQVIALVVLAVLTLTESSSAEDLEFFEQKYNRKITDVKPKGEYSGPDQYYRAIADQLGIPQIALDAVTQKFGWEAGVVNDAEEDGVWRHGDTIQYMMVKRGPGHPGQWQCMVIQVSIDPETEKPITQPEIQWVFVDDDMNILFPELLEEKSLPEVPKENESAERGAAGQPASAGDSK